MIHILKKILYIVHNNDWSAPLPRHINTRVINRTPREGAQHLSYEAVTNLSPRRGAARVLQP